MGLQTEHRQNRTTRRIKAAAIASAALLLGACTGVKPPKFELAGVERSGPEGSLVLVVEARNDNDTAMPLHKARYRVALDGETRFEGERSPEVTLPAFGEATFTLPTPIESDAGGEVRVTGHVTFIEPGRLAEILFDSDVRRPEAPLRLEGRLTP